MPVEPAPWGIECREGDMIMERLLLCEGGENSSSIVGIKWCSSPWSIGKPPICGDAMLMLGEGRIVLPMLQPMLLPSAPLDPLPGCLPPLLPNNGGVW